MGGAGFLVAGVRSTRGAAVRAMTKLLEKAFREASKLSESEQNAFAERLLAELRSEARWEKAFAGSQDVLEALADEALNEKRRGKTVPLDFDRL